MPPPTREGQCEGKGKLSQPADAWIFIVKDDAMTRGLYIGDREAQPTLCKFRHPRQNIGVLYLVSADCRNVLELNCFQENHRAWFLGDTVHNDGQVFITSPIDPLFLVLPYLMDPEKNRFMTLDQLVCDEDFPLCHKLVTCCSHDQLALICDWKDIDTNVQVYRFNKEKALNWLKIKTEVLADTLADKKISVSAEGSHSAIFVRGKREITSRDAFMEYAFGIISDYLAVSLETELRHHLQLPEVNTSSLPDCSIENEPPLKKAKISESVASLEDYSQDVKKEKSKTVKMTAAQKKLSKVDKAGMKSISSFFSAKC